jgi:ribonuclease HII
MSETNQRKRSSFSPLLSAAQYCLENRLIFSAPVAGVDEVGRGPLVGAVVAAAVILPEHHGITGLADSKKMSEQKRDSLSVLIKERALAWAIGRAEADEIDQINILQASLLAMSRAVAALQISPTYALIDGNKKPKLNCQCATVIKGDGRIEEIAAASIVAKVHRDEEMYRLDEYYPQYGFAQHKGYPTALHFQMLAEHGVTPMHRKSFAPVKKIIESSGC